MNDDGVLPIPKGRKLREDGGVLFCPKCGGRRKIKDTPHFKGI